MQSAAVKEIFKGIVARADAARDAGRFHDAALLYGEALRLFPKDAGIHVQCGNMFKDSGDHAGAEDHYKQADTLWPGDADLAVQMGHLYKSWGRTELATAAYERAAVLAPDWEIPAGELQRIAKSGWRKEGDAGAPLDFYAHPPTPADLIKAGQELGIATDIEHIAPELFPSPLGDLRNSHAEEIHFRAVGRRERSYWGILNTLRGIEAIRGFCISASPVLEVQLYLNDQLIYRGIPAVGVTLVTERNNHSLRKYNFNFWLDFSQFVRGRHDFEIRTIDARQRSQNRHETIVIADPLDEADFPTSDQRVTLPPDDPRSVDEQIDARASMIRPARRAMLSEMPRTILIQRTDQLGDFVVSVPAMRRLRAMFPDAKLVGLFSAANAELGASLKLFDDIVLTDFPDDREQRRRIMPLETQVALREKLAAYDFDMVIDLSENSPSRLLFTLSNAPFRYGFRHHQMPNLSLDLEGNSHDRFTTDEVVPHSNKLIGMTEWLRAMMRSEPNIERREDLGRDALASFGLDGDERFAVIHDGARLSFSRWPHYRTLAAMILAATSLQVVMLTDDPDMRSTLPPELAESDRFQLIDGRVKFDEFDALVSFCSVFVGNDSGPKHLASFRGAKVVSIHMARNSWNEWGQESSGYIISRKVPCAGCQIHHDPDECGRDFVCIRNIKPEEVMQAVHKLL